MHYLVIGRETERIAFELKNLKKNKGPALHFFN